MLGRRNSLLFPRLVHVKEINNFGKQNKTIQLYKLDWSGMEDILKERHEKWREGQEKLIEEASMLKCTGNKEYLKDSFASVNKEILKESERCDNVRMPLAYEYFPALPPDEMKHTDETLYALTDNYRKEIIRNSKRAVEERNIERSFDTMIRDICQEPCESHVFVAFRLLADCVYDSETKNFSRDYDFRHMLPKWLLYRFWIEQTGRGVAYNRAGLYKMRDSLEDAGWRKNQSEDSLKRLERYLSRMEKHYEDLENHMFGRNGNPDDGIEVWTSAQAIARGRSYDQPGD